LWTDFDEIFWRGRAWLKDQVIQFWWRSGSRFGSGSPKSEIRILRIGRGLCCLSISSYKYVLWSKAKPVLIIVRLTYNTNVQGRLIKQLAFLCKLADWKNIVFKKQNWIQLLFAVKATALKQQNNIKILSQILSTEASHHIYASQQPVINAKSSTCAYFCSFIRYWYSKYQPPTCPVWAPGTFFYLLPFSS